jgi:hypothetical protein
MPGRRGALRIVLLATALSGCHHSPTASSEPRDVSVLVEMTCAPDTPLRDVQYLWDGTVLSEQAEQGFNGNFYISTGGGTIATRTGKHTVGVRIVAQDASPNTCYLDVTVTTPSTGTLQYSDYEQRSLGTGQLSTFAVTIE